MRKCLFVFLLLLVVAGSACQKGRLGRLGVYDQLTPKEFATSINATQEAQIVDVRSVHEYENGHLPAAINAPYFGGEFLNIIDSLSLDTTQPVYIYCQTQHRSPPAARLLYSRGFTRIIDLKKGFWKWKRKGQEVIY